MNYLDKCLIKKKLVNNNKKSATNLCECEDVYFPIKIVFWIYL